MAREKRREQVEREVDYAVCDQCKKASAREDALPASWIRISHAPFRHEDIDFCTPNCFYAWVVARFTGHA